MLWNLLPWIDIHELKWIFLTIICRCNSRQRMSNGVFLSALQLNAGLQLNCNQVRDVWICQYGCFFGKIPKRGGVISDPKNYIADFFGFKTVYFGRKFWTKWPKKGGGGGGHLQSKKFHCKFTQVKLREGVKKNVFFRTLSQTPDPTHSPRTFRTPLSEKKSYVYFAY